MSTQVCAFVEKPGKDARIEFRSTPTPSPAPGNLIVKLEASGVCHSDCHSIYGTTPMQCHIAGHEGVGEVISVGKNVSEDQVGSIVGVSWLHRTCNICDICNIDYAHCPRQDNTGRNVDGTFQEYCEADAAFVTPIPAALSATVAAPLLCGGVTMYGALRRADLSPGQFVVIPGAGGGLGHLGIQIAVALGLRVIALDTGDAKRQLCKELGAEQFIDFVSSNSVIEDVHAFTSGGAHGMIVATGSPATYDSALSMLRNCGKLVCVGIPPNDYRLGLNVFEVLVKGIRIIGSSVGSQNDMKQLMELALEGKIRPHVKEYQFSDLERVLQDLQSGRVTGRAVIKF